MRVNCRRRCSCPPSGGMLASSGAWFVCASSAVRRSMGDGREPVFHGHIAWHSALGALERGDPERALAEAWRPWRASIAEAHRDPGTADPRKRLAYDEVFANQLALMLLRQAARRKRGVPLAGDGRLTEKLRLPYGLTGAQRRVVEEIRGDMAQAVPMLRLLQGDVGSGKTLVALLAMLAAVEAGAQAALLAPTEILDAQLSRLERDAGMATGRLGIGQRDVAVLGAPDQRDSSVRFARGDIAGDEEAVRAELGDGLLRQAPVTHLDLLTRARPALLEAGGQDHGRQLALQLRAQAVHQRGGGTVDLVVAQRHDGVGQRSELDHLHLDRDLRGRRAPVDLRLAAGDFGNQRAATVLVLDFAGEGARTEQRVGRAAVLAVPADRRLLALRVERRELADAVQDPGVEVANVAAGRAHPPRPVGGRAGDRVVLDG